MIPRGKGVGAANWLVSKTSGLLDAKISRRSLISRATLIGTAVAVTGCRVVTRPGTPYTRVTDCGAGTLCRDGYTEFCCVINQGINACPSNTITAGWWRADYSVFCNGTRYYIDCNESCCGPRRSDGFCASCEPTRCAAGCNTRKVYANYFRYGQCHQIAAHVGPIACRMVTCVPPYQLNIGCTASGAVDNLTANHNANCAAYAPPPPPPPITSPPAVEVPLGTAVVPDANQLAVLSRASTGEASELVFDGVSWGTWAPLAGLSVASRVGGAAAAPGELVVLSKGNDGALWSNTVTGGVAGGWSSVGGAASADPVAVAHGGTVFGFSRRPDKEIVFSQYASGAWAAWQSLGGTVTSDPAVVSDPSGLYLFGRGSDTTLWYRRRVGASFSDWTSLGGYLSSDPVAVSGPSGLYVFVLSHGHSVWYRRASGGTFEPWGSLGASATSDVAAAAGTSGVWAFIRWPDNGLAYQHFNGSSWSGWIDLGLTVTSDPVAIEVSGTVHVFVRGADNALWTRESSGGSFSPWLSLGGSLEPVRGAPSA